MNYRRIAVVVIADVFILAELTLALYLAHLIPETLTTTFFMAFVPMALGTIFISKRALRRLDVFEDNQAETEAPQGSQAKPAI